MASHTAAGASHAGTVVVVGAGLAGMTAAITAAEADPSVHVIVYDKEPHLGGNSAKATSGMNAAGELGLAEAPALISWTSHQLLFADTPTQAEAGIDDSFDVFVDDTMKSGHGECDFPLVAQLVSSSKSAWQFIAEHGEPS